MFKVPPNPTTGADAAMDRLAWPPVLHIVVGDGPVATLTPMEASYLIRDMGELLAVIGSWTSGSCMNGKWPHQIAEGAPELGVREVPL